jgi:hypothetical protein
MDELIVQRLELPDQDEPALDLVAVGKPSPARDKATVGEQPGVGYRSRMVHHQLASLCMADGVLLYARVVTVSLVMLFRPRP